MELECVERYRSFCGGYAVLLRLDARMERPKSKKMAEYYDTLFNGCLSWAETYGKNLQKIYENTQNHAEKAGFRPRTYRLRIYPTYEDDRVIAFLCESAMMGQWKGPGEGYRRLSQVWNIREEQMLPPQQIMEYFGFHLSKKRLPFAPDGIYPQDGKLIIFQNLSGKYPFRQQGFEISK